MTTAPSSTTDDWLGLAGRRVLVVGAGAFGSACATAFLDQGASVLVADFDQDVLRDFTNTVGGDRPTSVLDRTFTHLTDIRSATDCAELMDVVQERLGGLDVLVHAVGINRRLPIGDTSDDDWNDVLATNLSSAFWLARASLKLLRASDHAKVVFFSSVSAFLAHPKHGAYAASKGGLNQLVKVLAMELAEDSVHVNAVAPGYVETSLTADYLARPGVRDDLASRVPMGRLGAVDDVVGPVLFLASRRSDFITGQALIIDGGRSLD